MYKYITTKIYDKLIIFKIYNYIFELHE